MSTLLDPTLTKVLAQDKHNLETTALPIVTVSATYREDIKGLYGYPENESIPDVVFSRAHYSMAAGIAITAWGKKLQPEKAWVVDPTNYVSHKNWRSIELTEFVGKTLARQPLLKRLKDLIDSFGRSKLPILGSIAPPLLHLTQHVQRPILSLHIAAGNILAEQGKTVVQMVTDPHIRDEYLNNVDKENFYLLVFDEKTKTDALEKASLLGKQANPDRIIVTGPPVDPRIVANRLKKHPWRSGVLRLCMTTGGLGTNKVEIRQLLTQLLPELRKRPSPYQLMIYCGTHKDILDMVKNMAKEARVKLNVISDLKAPRPKADMLLTALYHPQIVDANEILIKYSFPWAHGFISKPSGDMAYDAAASGSFLLTLKEWGEWEYNIMEIFKQKGIARRAETDHIVAQLEALTSSQGKSESWVEQAMRSALTIDRQFRLGTEEIIRAYKKIK
ncbi:MAG TPA: hypothetical protein VF209_01315 [Patescibacteria group bacterium]